VKPSGTEMLIDGALARCETPPASTEALTGMER
jgi:hypothetical protein